ncbi:hypothetical protein [Hyalangium versicolor]|uniref:hypothetical protein n=1 Tax=Hyalangium versicolor TaxID=2861190 RepID=UPI001CC9DBC6|nr:hypothetical protein [Hyalangium versicolor]
MLTRTLVLLLLCALPALAQEPKLLDPNKVPREGQDPKVFVPQGWRIEDIYKGDLNKDDSLDVVIQLVEDGPETDAEGVVQTHSRALVVLLEQGGKLHRVGVSNRVLYCTTCGGALSAPGPGQVKIEKGIILVDQLRGAREIVHTILRFRYEPQDKRVLLIGQDDIQTDRNSGESKSVSINRLTGKRITEKLQYDAKKDKDVVLSSKQDKVTVKKQYLEDVVPPEE